MLTSEVYEEKINAYLIGQSEKVGRNNYVADLYKLYVYYVAGCLAPFTIHKKEEMQPRHRELKKQLAHFSIREFNKVIKQNAKIDPSAKLSNNIFIGTNTIIA